MNAILANVGSGIGKFFDALSFIWGREPVAIIGVVDGVLILLVSFGVPISPEQKTAIDALLGAIGIVFARSRVSPV